MIKKDNLDFIKQALINPGDIGNIWPSSKKLAQVMVSDIDSKKAGIVLEIGPGTGALTREIIKKISPNQYIGVEKNECFYKVLVKKFPECDFQKNDVCDWVSQFDNKTQKRTEIMAIICSIPFASISKKQTNEILSALNPWIVAGVSFIMMQYVNVWPLKKATYIRQELDKKYRKKSKKTFVLENFPPVIVLQW